MNGGSLEEIHKHALAFRDAIDRCDRSLFPYFLERFPSGACGDVVLLLGTYLLENGFKGFGYVRGVSGSWEDDTRRSHAWLQRGALVVDITADQFPEMDERVLVLEDSEWHLSFRVSDKPKPADLKCWEGGGMQELRDFYQEILACIES